MSENSFSAKAIRAGYEWRTGWKEVLEILLKNKSTK